MADYLDLVPDVVRECPNAPTKAIERELRLATVEFCRHSRFLRDLISIDLQPTVGDYRLRGPRETRIDQILNASLVTPRGAAFALRQLPAVQFEPKTGQPRYFAVTTSMTRVHFSPVPLEAGLVTHLHVVLVPTQESETLPDEVHERHRDALVSGAIARMTIVSNTPWSNPALSLEHQRRFQAGIRDARQMATSGGWMPMRTQMRTWV